MQNVLVDMFKSQIRAENEAIFQNFIRLPQSKKRGLQPAGHPHRREGVVFLAIPPKTV